MLLQLLNIQPVGIRYIFYLISIEGIVLDSRIVHMVLKFYLNFLA